MLEEDRIDVTGRGLERAAAREASLAEIDDVWAERGEIVGCERASSAGAIANADVDGGTPGHAGAVDLSFLGRFGC